MKFENKTTAFSKDFYNDVLKYIENEDLTAKENSDFKIELKTTNDLNFKFIITRYIKRHEKHGPAGVFTVIAYKNNEKIASKNIPFSANRLSKMPDARMSSVYLSAFLYGTVIKYRD